MRSEGGAGRHENRSREHGKSEETWGLGPRESRRSTGDGERDDGGRATGRATARGTTRAIPGVWEVEGGDSESGGVERGEAGDTGWDWEAGGRARASGRRGRAMGSPRCRQHIESQDSERGVSYGHPERVSTYLQTGRWEHHLPSLLSYPVVAVVASCCLEVVRRRRRRVLCYPMSRLSSCERRCSYTTALNTIQTGSIHVLKLSEDFYLQRTQVPARKPTPRAHKTLVGVIM